VSEKVCKEQFRQKKAAQSLGGLLLFGYTSSVSTVTHIGRVNARQVISTAKFCNFPSLP